MSYTLGLAQCCHPTDSDPVALVERYAQRAAAQGVEILAFPESLMTPYEKQLKAFLREAQPIGGPFSNAICAIARRYGLWLVFTMNELNPEGNPYNTIVIVDSQGLLQASYRKVHLFDTDFTKESERMSAGDTLFSPISTPFGRIGLAICYDLRFPEVARFASLRKADILIYSAAWVSGEHKVEQWKTLLKARAIENEMYVAGLSRCDEGYIGNSIIVNPLGDIIAEAGDGEELLCALIDNDSIESVRERMPVLRHRKPEAYREP